MGENPIEKTIKLTNENTGDYYLEIRPDGTALYVYDDEPDCKFKYTYDADTKKIYMRLEQLAFSYIDGLLNYDENLALMDEVYSVAALKEWIKEEYDDLGKEKSDSYEDFEKDWYEEEGFDSLAAYAEYYKQLEKDSLKAKFGAQITYSYKIDDEGKMTLTEKFTGVKNLFNSSCDYSSNKIECYIYNDCADLEEYNDGKWKVYEGTLNTDKKTIVFILVGAHSASAEAGTYNKSVAFKSEDDGSIVNATYTENLSEETVTINFKGENYVCKFEGNKFIQK